MKASEMSAEVTDCNVVITQEINCSTAQMLLIRQ